MSNSSYEFPEELRNGLRNYWYPVFASEELSTDKPVAIRRLGEDLVLWRGDGGKPNLFVDYCPHRGAPLSLGRLHDGMLECWYHGQVYDGSGQCRFVPYDRNEDGPTSKNYKVKSYPVEEQAGYIWAYIGDVEMFPPPPFTLEPELEEGSDFHTLLHYDEPWDAAWPLVIDNANDPNHVVTLHRESSAAFIPAEDLFDFGIPTHLKVQVTEGDIRIGGSGGCRVQQTAERKIGDNEYEEFVLPTMNRIDVSAPGRGEPIRSIHFIVPIDEHKTQNYWYICKKVKNDEERQQWEQMYYQKHQDSVAKIFAQDRAITEAQGAIEKARSSERMMELDKGLAQVRRLILRAWQAQQETINNTKTS